jgi:hypothetical protein
LRSKRYAIKELGGHRRIVENATMVCSRQGHAMALKGALIDEPYAIVLGMATAMAIEKQGP